MWLTYIDLQHHVLKLLLDGKLGLAPVENPRYALDIARGTGIWAIEFGMTIAFWLFEMDIH